MGQAAALDSGQELRELLEKEILSVSELKRVRALIFQGSKEVRDAIKDWRESKTVRLH